MDGALEALCFFIQLGITGLGLVLGLVFFAVGRGVADEAKKPWNVALAVTGILVLLGWVGLLLLVVAL
jgi:dipeptide/tripeptide permease